MTRESVAVAALTARAEAMKLVWTHAWAYHLDASYGPERMLQADEIRLQATSVARQFALNMGLCSPLPESAIGEPGEAS